MRVALAQLPCREGDASHNLARLLAAVAEAARCGADLLVAPEMQLCGFSRQPPLRELAETVRGPSLSEIAGAARRHRIHLVTGFCELDPESGQLFNSAACFDREGRLLQCYRKVHRFANELDLVVAGDALTPFSLEGLTVGILICYDLEFPEAARTLAMQGAQVLIIPSANMVPYGRVHRVLAQARALENHAYVLYANRCGSSGEFDFEGESSVVDPFGRVVAEGRSGAELVLADVDTSLFVSVQRTYSYFSDRRPGAYRIQSVQRPEPD